MILIVDDNVTAGNILRRLLKQAGHEVLYVSGGDEALAILKVVIPALMILDVNMPGTDGLAVLRTMNEAKGIKPVKVMMYSSETDRQTSLEATRLGAIDFVIKGSVSVDALLALIHTHQTPQRFKVNYVKHTY